MRIVIVSLMIVMISVCETVEASIFSSMLKKLRESSITQMNIYTASLNMLKQQQDISQMMHELNSNVTGHSGWGSYNTHDYQSYGNNADSWNKVIGMAESGEHHGEVGQVMQALSRQFPIDSATYNHGVNDSTSQLYYKQQAQTVLAARATSQLDYDRIKEQIAYQQMLQNQIEKTKDLKAAVDLSSRIQVEGNLIQLALLRQMALSNQQQALNNQSTLNSSLANARFLS